MNLDIILKKIEFYKTAIECVNAIQLLDEQEAGAIILPEGVTPFIIEIHLAALKRKEVLKLSNDTSEKNYRISQPHIESPLNQPNYAKFINHTNENTGV